MRRIYKIILLFPFVAGWTACSDEKGTESQEVKSDGMVVGMDERDAALSKATRAVTGFAVNTGNDPTKESTRLTGGAGTWNLDATIYDRNGQPYAAAAGTWTYNAGAWTPAGALYLPSYFKPRVTASLFPATRSAAALPETDQNTGAKLLLQDLLVQRTDPYTVTPAHILTVELKHRYAMFDVILTGVNTGDIKSVSVTAGTATYAPYRITALPNEYLVILPTGIANPKVIVETNAGARYTETLLISSTTANYCYCIKMAGPELTLSSVTVIDWAYGTALSGQYTTPTSYPTFQGYPDTTVTLTYDNGLSQQITFDVRGETTVKPYGRTVVGIDGRTLPDPVILDRMYIDLIPFLPAP